MSTRTGAGRRYSGLGAAERVTTRRAAVLAAALELFGTKGFRATSVKHICREAGLTERYFYESFRDREASLTALYRALVAELRGATAMAIGSAGDDVDTIARSGLAAFIGYLTDDPRRARVIMIEVVGVSPDLEQRRHRVLAEFAELITAVWAVSTDLDTLTEHHLLTAVALVGAVDHLLVDWLHSGRHQSPEVLVDVCGSLFSAASDRLTAEQQR